VDGTLLQTLLPKVILTFSAALNTQLARDSILLSQDFWLLVSMLIVIPISFLRTLDALRFTSQIALATVAYLILVVVGWFILKGPDPNRGEIVLARFGKDTLSRFPVQVFAFTCAQNIFPIYNELSARSQQRMNIVILASIGSAAACYEILGVIGYLTFGSKVGSNIIAMYPPTSLVIAFGRLGIVLLVGLSYPLQLLPCRNCIHTLTRGLAGRIKEANQQAAAILTPSRRSGTASPARSIEEDETDPLMPLARYETAGSIRRGGDMTNKKFIFLTTMILAAGFLVAFSVDELEIGESDMKHVFPFLTL
jgi:amino acid permease